jgi:phosphinothricin acetyltransferase
MPETTLRVATVDDAPELAAIYAPYVRDTAISFETTPPTAGEMRLRIAEVLERHAWLVACVNGCVVGYAYASAHRPRAAYRWSVDLGVYVDASSHRRGIARRLYGALLTLLARQGYVNAYAGITLPNPASVGLHEAMGFIPVGIYRSVGYKLGAWHDVGWWSRQTRACHEAPEEPLPLAHLHAEQIKGLLAAG